MRPENKQKDAKSSPRCSLLKLKSKGKRESNDIRKYLNRMSQDQSLIVKTSKTELFSILVYSVVYRTKHGMEHSLRGLSLGLDLGLEGLGVRLETRSVRWGETINKP